MSNLSSYSDIPDVELRKIIEDAKDRLVANNLPDVDEKTIKILLQKVVWRDCK
jgi:Mg/Co/Ni transporter MgtE